MFERDAPLKPPICEQPKCALKQGHMNRPRLADLLVRALSKKNSIDEIPERMRITPREVCIECAQRVIRGHRPLLTSVEREKIYAELPMQPNPRTH